MVSSNPQSYFLTDFVLACMVWCTTLATAWRHVLQKVIGNMKTVRERSRSTPCYLAFVLTEKTQRSILELGQWTIFACKVFHILHRSASNRIHLTFIWPLNPDPWPSALYLYILPLPNIDAKLQLMTIKSVKVTINVFTFRNVVKLIYCFPAAVTTDHEPCYEFGVTLSGNVVGESYFEYFEDCGGMLHKKET